MLRALDRVTRLHPRQSRNHLPCRRRVLLYRHLGRRRHAAHAGTQDQLDFDRRHSARHRCRDAVAPNDAVVRARHLRSVCRRDLAIWRYSTSPITRSSRRRRLSRFDRRLQKDLFGARPIDLLRWAAGITLMWASIEKWAYPEWSYPLFIEHPGMSLGFTPEFYMRAAGAVEFALRVLADLDAFGTTRRLRSSSRRCS